MFLEVDSTQTKTLEARKVMVEEPQEIGINSVPDKMQHAKVEKLSRVKARGCCTLCWEVILWMMMTTSIC